MDGIQATFGRSVLRLAWNVSGEYVRQELGLESMQERASTAMLRYYGHLKSLPEDRLAGFLFRKRCEQVDEGPAQAKLSWCRHIKAVLDDFGCSETWAADRVPDAWHSFVRRRVHERVEAKARVERLAKPSMALLLQCGRLKLDGAMDYALRHPGAMLRLKLRCRALPLMDVVGDQVPAEQRFCRMCGVAGVKESAEHFACQCPFYAEERARCLRRVADLTAGLNNAALMQAVINPDVQLLLGDGLLLSLPPETAKGVNAAVCDFLMVAWRKRKARWRHFCVEGNEWKLRV